MPTAPRRPRSRRLRPHLLLASFLTACSGGGGEAPVATGAAKAPPPPSATTATQADTPTPPAAADPNAPADSETGGTGGTGQASPPPPHANADAGAPAAAGTGGDPTHASAAASGTGGDSAAAPAAAASGTGGGAAASGTAADPAAPTEGTPAEDPAAQLTALMAEIGSTKTPDERVFAAIDEALALGASTGRVGRAINRRAARLFETPERAIAMYEWSREHYTNSPVASFELAKYACNTGDIDRTISLLEEVKARGGDEQLQTVGFDPTFALVVNESKVQALLR